MSRKHEQVGGTVQRPFISVGNRPTEKDVTLQSEPHHLSFEVGTVPSLIGTGNDQLPARGTDFSPDIEKHRQPLFWVNPREKERSARAFFGSLRSGLLGRHLDPVRDHGDGSAETHYAEALHFLFGRGMEETGSSKVPSLV